MVSVLRPGAADAPRLRAGRPRADEPEVAGAAGHDRGDGFYHDLIDHMSDGMYFVNRQRRITYWSGGAERLTGFPAQAVQKKRCGASLLNHVDDAGEGLCGTRCPLAATMRDGQIREAHVFLRHADGSRRPVVVRAAPRYGPDGKITGAVETFSDDSVVRAARAELEDLQQIALVDQLTGLGNRRFLESKLTSWIGDWTSDKVPFGVLFADIDHFKKVNDTYGHSVGDEALAMVARTLSFVAGTNCVPARYGGEEFVVMVRGRPETLVATAEKLRSLVAASQLVIANQVIDLTISLGCATVAPGDDGASLLRRADLALYRAKEGGRNRVEADEAMLVDAAAAAAAAAGVVG
jgi:diguanylate cyclase (GGDEF)-like protein/PAS domain S-box-containing protein